MNVLRRVPKNFRIEVPHDLNSLRIRSVSPRCARRDPFFRGTEPVALSQGAVMSCGCWAGGVVEGENCSHRQAARYDAAAVPGKLRRVYRVAGAGKGPCDVVRLAFRRAHDALRLGEGCRPPHALARCRLTGSVTTSVQICEAGGPGIRVAHVSWLRDVKGQLISRVAKLRLPKIWS